MHIVIKMVSDDPVDFVILMLLKYLMLCSYCSQLFVCFVIMIIIMFDGTT